MSYFYLKQNLSLPGVFELVSHLKSLVLRVAYLTVPVIVHMEYN